MAKSPKASALIDTRVIYCGDNLDQLRTPPGTWIAFIYIDRDYKVWWLETNRYPLRRVT